MSENIRGFLGSLSRWRGGVAISLTNDKFVSGSFWQMPSVSTRTQGLGFGRTRLGEGRMGEGTELFLVGHLPGR